MSGKALKSITIVFVAAVAVAGIFIGHNYFKGPEETGVIVEIKNLENEVISIDDKDEVTVQIERNIDETKIEKETQDEEIAVEEIKKKTKKAEVKAFDVKNAMKDRVKGRIEAPITIYEYASYTCSHCGTFYTKTLPKIKKKFIDTGMVKFIFRDFPLDSYALTASKITRCLPDNQYYNMVEVYFSNIKRWLQSPDPVKALAQLGALAGMNEEKFTACNSNKDLDEAIMVSMKQAQEKYKIKATPTFVFNDGEEIIHGSRPVEAFEKVISKLMAEKKSEQGK